MVQGKRDKIARYVTPSEGAFLGTLLRQGANWIAGRHKDSIRGGLNRAARMGMFGRRKVKAKPRVPMPPPPNYPSWLKSRWG